MSWFLASTVRFFPDAEAAAPSSQGMGEGKSGPLYSSQQGSLWVLPAEGFWHLFTIKF